MSIFWLSAQSDGVRTSLVEVESVPDAAMPSASRLCIIGGREAELGEGWVVVEILDRAAIIGVCGRAVYRSRRMVRGDERELAQGRPGGRVRYRELFRGDRPRKCHQHLTHTHRIKCNKAIPCDNCIRRGHPESCTRLPAIVRGRLINAPSAAQRAPLTPDQIRLLREGQLQRENVGLRRRVGDLESRIRELEAGGSGSTPSARPGSRARDSGPASGPTPSSSADSPLDGGNAFAHLLSAANGHAASGHTAHREGPEKSRQDDPDVLEPFVHVMGIPKQPERAGSPHPGAGRSSGNGGLPDLPSRKSTDLGQTDLLTLLPTPPQSSLIIRASFKYLCFFHPSVHVPTFIKEHDEWIAATAEGENLEKGDAWLSYCE